MSFNKIATYRSIGVRESSKHRAASLNIRADFNSQMKEMVSTSAQTIVGPCRKLLLISFVMALCCAGLFAEAKKPNIVVFWGDDIGQSNISAYSKGMMGYRTPNIDRIAKEGMLFTDYYAEQSCTAGRAAFIMGQSVFRSGLSKVGLPGAAAGMRAEDPTIAEMQIGRAHV